MDPADRIIDNYCGYTGEGCGLSDVATWTSADISALITALDAELQRREHSKSVQAK